MKALGDYEIQFSGLKEGMHEFDFDVPPGFFEHFNNPDYPGGRLKVKIMLDRKPQMLTLNFSLEGFVRITCDRCLEKFDYPVSTQEMIFVKFGDRQEEINDQVIVIPREESRINVAQFIFEFAILNLPMQRIHPDDETGSSGCDAEMLSRLKKHSSGKIEQTDPRWDILQKIFKN